LLKFLGILSRNFCLPFILVAFALMLIPNIAFVNTFYLAQASIAVNSKLCMIDARKFENGFVYIRYSKI
jgi:hypothetical protein